MNAPVVIVSIPPEGLGIVDLLVVCGLQPSKGAARRLVEQGGAFVGGVRATAETVVTESAMVRAGKTSEVWARLVVE